LGPGMLAGLHIQQLDEIYSNWRTGYVKPPPFGYPRFGYWTAARYNPG
jgi:hypothetical protein